MEQINKAVAISMKVLNLLIIIKQNFSHYGTFYFFGQCLKSPKNANFSFLIKSNSKILKIGAWNSKGDFENLA